MHSGFKPQDYPDGAYFTPDYRLAEEYAECYQDGILKIEIPSDTYSKYYKPLETPYQSNPSQIEMVIPPAMFDDLNSHSRTIISGPWIGGPGVHSMGPS